MTPFYANYGMHPTMTDLPSEGQYDVPKRIKRLLESRDQIKAQLVKAQERQAAGFNRSKRISPNFQIGDMVYLSTENLVTDEGSKKLSDLRTGPYPITKKVREGAYKLKLPPHMKVNPTFNVRLLTKAHPDPIIGRAPSEPAPIIINRHEEYTIKKFLNSNWLGKHFQYKVRYDGYGKEHDEWLFRDDLLEDLGEESLLDYEAEFYGKHPAAKRHTDVVREHTKGKRTIKRR